MGARAILAAASLSLAGLAACAPPVPVPVEQAERDCLYDAVSARSPRTSIAIGIGSGGRTGLGVADRRELVVVVGTEGGLAVAQEVDRTHMSFSVGPA